MFTALLIIEIIHRDFDSAVVSLLPYAFAHDARMGKLLPLEFVRGLQVLDIAFKGSDFVRLLETELNIKFAEASRYSFGAFACDFSFAFGHELIVLVLDLVGESCSMNFVFGFDKNFLRFEIL